MPFGRPFQLGPTRVEIFQSGLTPGTAGFWAQTDLPRGPQTQVFVGPIGRSTSQEESARWLMPELPARQVRNAEALCIDATFGLPEFVFPNPLEAMSRAAEAKHRAEANGKWPVFLATHPTDALFLARQLTASGSKVALHRGLARSVSTYFPGATLKSEGIAVANRPRAEHVTIWPADRRHNSNLTAWTEETQLILASGWACDGTFVADLGVAEAVPLSLQGGYADLLAYVADTAAAEIGTLRSHNSALAATLRKGGKRAYPLGPPKQMPLFPPAGA